MAAPVPQSKITSTMCGWQTEYGTGQERYCAETKQAGTDYCKAHNDFLRNNY